MTDEAEDRYYLLREGEWVEVPYEEYLNATADGFRHELVRRENKRPMERAIPFNNRETR